MVGRAIASLLKFNSRVVIPEFGAVIKNFDFSQKAFFNQFIKYDDGLLMDYLTDTSGLSKDEAEAAIYAFIRQVTEETEKGNHYHVEDVGYFCLQDERIELYSSLDDIPFSQREEVRTAPIASEQADREPAGHPAVATSTQEEYINEEEPANAIPAWPAANEVAGEQEEEEEEEEGEETDVYNEHEPAENTSKGKRVWIAAGVAAGIIAIIVVVLVYKTMPFTNGDNDGAFTQTAAGIAEHAGISPVASTTDTEPEESDNGPEKKAVDAEPATSKETAPKAQPEEKPREQEMTLSTGYHVIIGAFKNERYADRLVKNCRHAGIEARKLPEWNDDFFLVSYAKFESLDRAKEEHQKIIQQYAGAWLVGEP